MLSLPPFPPRADESLWPSHRVSNYFDSSSGDSHSQNANNGHRRQNSHGHNGHHHHNNSHRGYLATLAADENTIYQRKQNVRRFGAGWIRPPGVAKTYQATMDEAAEREEQEILARREQALLDMQAAQTDAANQEAAAEGQEEDTMEAERDMDDDVPEAEAEESEVSDSDEGSELEEGDTSAMLTNADMTFNEDSFIEGSMVEAEVEDMLEREEAEISGVLQDERDLDDDVPEAGSYEHTDTEIDYSSDVDGSSRISNSHISTGRRVSMLSTGRRRSGRRSSGLPSGMPSARSTRSGRPFRSSINPRESINNPRSSINPRESIDPRHSILDASNTSFGLDGSSSLLDGSSFFRSSPVVARGNLRTQFMGARAPPWA